MGRKTNRFKAILLISLCFLLVLTFLNVSPVAAKYPNPDKPIKFIIPVSVGGGYDLYVRMLVPYLMKELNAKIVIRNIPGGEWMIGYQKIYSAKPDGYTIGIWNPGSLMNDRDIRGKANFDMTTFTYLYRVTDEPRVVIIKTDGPIKDFKDLIAKGKSPDFKLRNSYAGGTARLDALLMKAEWDVNAEGIAYSSGSKTRLAVMRGDTHFCISGLGSGMDAIPTKRVKFALLNSDVPITQVPEAEKWIKEFPELKDVPIPADLGLKPLSYVSKSARCVIAPPGLPEDIKKTLIDALEKVIRNPKLRKQGLKSDRPFGKGQRGDAYQEQMKKDKAVLIKLKHLLK